jgi:hypothetical protein
MNDKKTDRSNNPWKLPLTALLIIAHALVAVGEVAVLSDKLDKPLPKEEIAKFSIDTEEIKTLVEQGEIFQSDTPAIYLNGKEMTFNKPLMVKDGNKFVSITDIDDNIPDFKFEWNMKKYKEFKIICGETTIVFEEGNLKCEKNGEETELAFYPFFLNSQFYVPIRDVMDAFGYEKTGYDSKNNIVNYRTPPPPEENKEENNGGKSWIDSVGETIQNLGKPSPKTNPDNSKTPEKQQKETLAPTAAPTPTPAPSVTQSPIPTLTPTPIPPPSLTPETPTPPVINVTGLNISKSGAALIVGETYKLTATVIPENASNKGISWISGNKNIAIVSSSGVVKAESQGTVDIQATTEDGMFSKVCHITVNPKPQQTPASEQEGAE